MTSVERRLLLEQLDLDQLAYLIQMVIDKNPAESRDAQMNKFLMENTR